MNLQENIHRIHQMMGLMTENKKVEVLRNMIDKMGLYQSSKMVGGYGELKDLITKEEKIDFINQIVQRFESMFGQGGFSPNDVDMFPIPYESDDRNYTGYIEHFLNGSAVVFWYDDVEDLVGDTTIGYDELSDKIIDEIVSNLINVKDRL